MTEPTSHSQSFAEATFYMLWSGSEVVDQSFNRAYLEERKAIFEKYRTANQHYPPMVIREYTREEDDKRLARYEGLMAKVRARA